MDAQLAHSLGHELTELKACSMVNPGAKPQAAASMRA